MLKQSRTDKPCPFHRRFNIEYAGKHCRLVRDNSNASACNPCEAHHDVLGKLFMHFKKAILVYYDFYYLLDIIGLVGVSGYVIPAHTNLIAFLMK